MRLPWLQVNSDGVTRARAFGRLYGIGEDAGVGVVMRLWAWALELSPDGDFSGTVTDARGLSAGCGLDPQDSARVVSELQRVGLVATTPTLRVRGLDRYAPAWRKNRKSHGTSAGPDANQPGFPEKPKRKTETETETEKIKSLATEVKPPSPSERIFEHWKTATGKPKAKADPKRLRLIQARLDEGYTEDDLRASIGWYAKSPFHCGENDRHKKYLGLDLMLRDAAHVDAGLDGPTKPTTVVKTTPDPLPEAYR